MVLRVGWYSNKAESNSIHWTEESVGQQRGAAELLLQARQRRQTARLGRTRNSGKLIRLTLVSFLPSFLPQKKKKKSTLVCSRSFRAVRRTPPPPFLLLLLPPDRISCTLLSPSVRETLPGNCSGIKSPEVQRLTLKSKSHKPETKELFLAIAPGPRKR